MHVLLETARHPLRDPDALLILVFCLWFTLSAIRQCRKRRPVWLQRLDPLVLVPSWRFFGPEPSVSDLSLLLNCVGSDPSRPAKLDITFHMRRSYLRGFAWNPERRLRKVFTGYCRVLASRKRGTAYTAAKTLMLNHIASLDHSLYGRERSYEIHRCHTKADGSRRSHRQHLSPVYRYQRSKR